MKTPRGILLERHRQAEAKLDAVRRNALATLPAAEAAGALRAARSGALLLRAALSKAWLELICPCRRAWAGMAALWLALAAANLGMKAAFPTGPALASAPARELGQALEEQRRLLAELLPPVQPPAIQPARPSRRSRSERPAMLKAC
jgi:hypothetical protein